MSVSSALPAAPAPADDGSAPADDGPAFAVTPQAVAADDLIALLPSPTGSVAFVTNGRGLVGWGEHASLRVTAPDAAAQIERWFADQVAALGASGGDSAELGPICVVSLGFSPHDESVAVIPEVLLRSTDRGIVCTRITASGLVYSSLASGSDLEGSDLEGEPEPVTGPGEVRYSDSELSIMDFIAAVETAVDRIKAGEAAKVVLAHGLTARTQFPVDERFLLARLAERYPSCSVYAVDGLIGASPEMLLRRHGTAVTSRVLAGTAWPEHAGSPGAGGRDSGSPLGAEGDTSHRGDSKGGSPDSALRAGLLDAERAGSGGGRRVDESVPAEMHRVAADLLTSAKDLAEHGFAVRSVVEVLAPLTQALTVPKAPSVIELANLTHLATDVVGTLANSPAVPSALALAAALHPTAAVGGTPSEVAQAMIAELEPTPRGRYAAPVGWIDARGDGEFAIALRCARVDGHTVTMVAGCGIVADSDPMNEAREAQIKMLPIRDALEE